MDVNVNITINGEEPEVKIDKPVMKKKVKHTKNGKETVLSMPESVNGDNERSTLLNLMEL